MIAALDAAGGKPPLQRVPVLEARLPGMWPTPSRKLLPWMFCPEARRDRGPGTRSPALSPNRRPKSVRRRRTDAVRHLVFVLCGKDAASSGSKMKSTESRRRGLFSATPSRKAGGSLSHDFPEPQRWPIEGSAAIPRVACLTRHPGVTCLDLHPKARVAAHRHERSRPGPPSPGVVAANLKVIVGALHTADPAMAGGHQQGHAAAAPKAGFYYPDKIRLLKRGPTKKRSRTTPR